MEAIDEVGGAPHGSDTSKVVGLRGGVIDNPFGSEDEDGFAGVDHDGAAHGSSISPRVLVLGVPRVEDRV